MSRLIMNFPRDLMVDHRNHNTLDNQRCNLRVCTNIQNQQNKKRKINIGSKYKGIHFYKQCKKWQAKIKYNKRQLFLGYFDKEINAAKAYDKKAKELFGEFAFTNF